MTRKEKVRENLLTIENFIYKCNTYYIKGAKKMFLLSFDLPKNMNTLRVRIFRRLKSSGAELVHHSLWRSNDFKLLQDIALLIRKNGGTALILEEKLRF